MATQSELYTAALAEGLPPHAARVAAAVGMAESGGNLTAHNTNAATGDNSYGAWQINMIEGRDIDVAKRRREIGITSNDQLFDLRTNAHAMKVISSNGSNFYPWSTYAKGKHLEFMSTPVTDQGSNDPGWWEKVLKIASPAYAAATAGGTVSDVAGGIGNAVELMSRTAVWVSDSRNWLRVVYVVGGGYMILAGLQMMVLQGTGVGRIVANVVPVGKAAKVVKTVAT